MLEKTIEAHLVKRVKERGGVAYKFTSPQRRSVPDRLVLLGAEHAGSALRKKFEDFVFEDHALCEYEDEDYKKWACEILTEMVHFVELKAPGRKPTLMQLREHERLRALGFTVLVIDNKEEIDKRYGK